jgi:RHS repeat-associated protein
VQATTGGQVTNYLWDELPQYGDVVLDTDAGGVVLASYVLAESELISQRRAGSTSYYLHDAQGSVRALTDLAGAITDQYTYAAFGELVEQEGATDNPYRYTGQQYDEASGLYSLRARYYDPADGRFLSRDPLEQWRNLRELNRYSYAANDAVNLVDPSGLIAMLETGQLDYAVGISPRAAAGLFARGAVRGVFFAFILLLLGASGWCGPRVKQQTVAMEWWQVLLTFAVAAAAGGALSVLTVSPFASMRAAAGAFKALFGAIGYSTSLADMLVHWEVNLCNVLGAFLSIYAIWKGLGLVRQALPQPAASQAEDTAQEHRPASSSAGDRDGGRLRVSNNYGPGDCDKCAADMNRQFGDRVIVLQNDPPGKPLLGPEGQDIGADKGWHLVTVDPEGIVYDPSGPQGHVDTYLAAIRQTNPGVVISDPVGTYGEAEAVWSAYDNFVEWLIAMGGLLH